MSIGTCHVKNAVLFTDEGLINVAWWAAHSPRGYNMPEHPLPIPIVRGRQECGTFRTELNFLEKFSDSSQVFKSSAGRC